MSGGFNNPVRRTLVIGGTGNGTGFFEYNGTPSSSNPPVAYATPPGVTKDPFGNTLPLTNGGFTATTAANGLFAALQAAALILGSANVSTRILSVGAIALLDALADNVTPAIAISAPSTPGGNNGQIHVLGESKDASKPAQIVMGAPIAASSTTALVEMQGHAAVLPGDGNTYDTERLTIRNAAPVSIGTIVTTVFSHHLGIGTYEIEIWAVMNNATAADPATMSFAASGGLVAAGLVDFEAVTSGGLTPIYGASATFTTGFAGQAVTANQRIRVNLTLIVSTAGTLLWQGITAASTVNVNTNSRIRISPMVAT